MQVIVVTTKRLNNHQRANVLCHHDGVPLAIDKAFDVIRDYFTEKKFATAEWVHIAIEERSQEEIDAMETIG